MEIERKIMDEFEEPIPWYFDELLMSNDPKLVYGLFEETEREEID
jgi:hypothetical protein